MKRQLSVAVFLYVIFLLMSIPAQWGAVALAKFSDQRIQLLSPTGTIWQGKSRALQVGSETLKDFAWTLHSTSMLWGTAHIEAAWGADSHATVRVTRHALNLADAQITLPVTWLSSYFPATAQYGFGGEARIQTPALDWQFDDGLTGKMQIEWRDASTVKLPVQPLGDYQIEVTGEGQKGMLHLATLRGALTINGTGRWAAHDRFRFTGSVKPDPARLAEFTNLLSLTGNQPDNLGQYRLGF